MSDRCDCSGDGCLQIIVIIILFTALSKLSDIINLLKTIVHLLEVAP